MARFEVAGRAPADEVAAAARLRGATVGVVDGSTIVSRPAALREIGRALRFPAWYGRNLDALHDSLLDLSWLPAGEIVLVWANHDVLRDEDAAGYRAVLDVLRHAVEATGRAVRPLTVVLTTR